MASKVIAVCVATVLGAAMGAAAGLLVGIVAASKTELGYEVFLFNAWLLLGKTLGAISGLLFKIGKLLDQRQGSKDKKGKSATVPKTTEPSGSNG